MIGTYGHNPQSQQRHTDARAERLAQKRNELAARLAKLAGTK